MGRGQFGPVVREFRHLFGGDSVAGVSEWQLLHRYLDRRDEVAFGAIVARHGPMVLGVCRRVLLDPRDVEDAFQATFLILARKGATLGERDPVAHWLYGVAYRVSLRARKTAARRRALERPGAGPEPSRSDDPGRWELGAVIDEELARLPSKYRAPVVLCYLEGLSHEEACRALGWPLGTVKGRLARARDLLKDRLSRRGVAPASVAGLVALTREARAAVPPLLIEFAIRAAMAGRSAGMVPAAVSALAAGSLTTMFLGKLKLAGAALLVLGTGATLLAFQLGGPPGDAPATKGQKPTLKAEPVAKKAQVQAEEAIRTDDVPDWVAGWPAITKQTSEPDPVSKAIHKALGEPIAMKFPNETPLEDFLKYIRAATKGEGTNLPKGIPIYVVPQGLQDADKSMASTLSIDLEGQPLKTTLTLALRQLSLMYKVKDGLLIITSDQAENQETPLNIMQEKAMRGELTREQYKQLIEMLKLRNQVEKLMNPQPGMDGGFQ